MTTEGRLSVFRTPRTLDRVLPARLPHHWDGYTSGQRRCLSGFRRRVASRLHAASAIVLSSSRFHRGRGLAAFSPNSARLAISDSRLQPQVWVHDAATLQLLAVVKCEPSCCFAWLGTSRLVCGSHSGTVRVWNVAGCDSVDTSQLDTLVHVNETQRTQYGDQLAAARTEAENSDLQLQWGMHDKEFKDRLELTLSQLPSCATLEYSFFCDKPICCVATVDTGEARTGRSGAASIYAGDAGGTLLALNMSPGPT